MHRRCHLKSHFHAWVSGILRLKFKKEAEKLVVSHLFKKYCRTGFLVWQDITVMASHVRKNQALAFDKIRHVKITSAFAKWWEVVRSIKFINEVVKSFILEQKRKTFEEWSEIVKQQEKWSQSHRCIVGMRQQRCIQKSFRVWQERSLKKRKEREVVYKASVFRRQYTFQGVFQRLKGWMHDRQMKEGFSLLACGKLQNVCMKWAFNAWLRHAGICSKRRAALSKLQQGWDQHLLARTFGEFQELVTQNQHLRRAVVSALKKNHESTMMEKVEAWHWHHCVHFLLQAWIKYAKWKTFWRCMEKEAILTMVQSLQKRVLWAWQRLVREIAIRREEHQQQRFLQREAMVLATRTERKQKLELSSGVFKVWRERFQKAVNISCFINKRKHHMKGSVWSAWLHLAGRSHQAKGLRYQWLQSTLRSTFKTWHEACRKHSEESRNQEAEAASFAAWRCKHIGWLQWTAYVGCCKERVKALDDCLALIQTLQFHEYVKDMIHGWKDYTLERAKRREHSWEAEASYKRHKLADYFTAWHHYTAASKDSASSLRGTIQVYKQRGINHLRATVGSRYRFRQGFGHISHYGNGDIKFHNISTPSVVIEEVNSPVNEFEGSPLPCPSHFTPQVLLESDETYSGKNNGNLDLGPPACFLNEQLWSPARSTEYLSLVVEDDVEDWPFNDGDVAFVR